MKLPPGIILIVFFGPDSTRFWIIFLVIPWNNSPARGRLWKIKTFQIVSRNNPCIDSWSTSTEAKFLSTHLHWPSGVWKTGSGDHQDGRRYHTGWRHYLLAVNLLKISCWSKRVLLFMVFFVSIHSVWSEPFGITTTFNSLFIVYDYAMS